MPTLEEVLFPTRMSLLIYEKVNLNPLQNMILFAIRDKDSSYLMYNNILSRFGSKKYSILN